MKRKITIRIKDPQLRRIRNNLRLLLIKVALDKKTRLREERRKIWGNRFGDSREPNGNDKRLSKTLLKEMREIDTIIDRSICFCPACQRADQDMIFNPVTKVWFCVQCYNKNKDFYKYQERYTHLFS